MGAKVQLLWGRSLQNDGFRPHNRSIVGAPPPLAPTDFRLCLRPQKVGVPPPVADIVKIIGVARFLRKNDDFILIWGLNSPRIAVVWSGTPPLIFAQAKTVKVPSSESVNTF